MWIGIDVLTEDELGGLLGRPWFRSFVYDAGELALAGGLGEGRAREFLTGRFAAKEATLKVLGTGVGAGVTFRQVAVLRAESGAPEVRLSGAAARRARERGIGSVEVSITHKKGLVMAAALGVPEGCRQHGRPLDLAAPSGAG
ncbi:4'-phosphopantetheinyl transferase superfamily protein [Streptomyces sp. HU2014]|uniref:Holo-[acyl-carrier-protein] synthase n=1 Tax=Streptomyces albireticuli TaxID=1940 RepID=A0A1Z2KVL8_9ACTN|nr:MULTISPECIES: 4'-phosphopantetheinyl transferase superfamily protein [Streptomyces]ARZ66060.1 DNA-binding protein [Streptomyces albireticuli]UQI46317.1 4'-phosphopantetheinyl transferase superfamily protein [Streptomyces sp. HU2014]